MAVYFILSSLRLFALHSIKVGGHTNAGELQMTKGYDKSQQYAKGPGGSMSQVVGLPNNSYKTITNTAKVRARLCKLQNGCTRLTAASDKIYQLLTHGQWFSPGTPPSSTTKTGRHDIAEILPKVALKHQKSFIKSTHLK